MPEQELAHFKSGWRLGTISSLESFRSLCVYVFFPKWRYCIYINQATEFIPAFSCTGRIGRY